MAFFLTGCGFKIVHTSDLDQYCYACQSTGFAQCRTSKNKEGVTRNALTPEEAEKVLAFLKEKAIADNEDTSKTTTIINICGYRRMK